uniref:Uncharacterized protein n=1 Tax=Corvus moneduloides TaxID=1196302 RepID=A0A8U7MJX4_CORMO
MRINHLSSLIFSTLSCVQIHMSSFLLCWVAGDLTSFLGCFLTNQLPVQIVTAAFYVNKDLIMISQFVYCKLKNQKVTKGKFLQQLKCSP